MSSGNSTTDPHRRKAQAEKRIHTVSLSPCLCLCLSPTHTYTLSLDRHPPFVPLCKAIEQHHDIVLRPLPLFLALTQITLYHGHPLLPLLSFLASSPPSLVLFLSLSLTHITGDTEKKKKMESSTF